MINVLTVILAVWLVPTLGLNNGVALTPPMGFSTWPRFGCNTDCTNYPNECISENLILRQADIIDREGYKEAGYQYITLDDCWASKERDQNGRLQADPARFPNGIRFLINYVHSLGLKFGIYVNYGLTTCAGYPGSINHLKLDAETFAEWGVDHVKMGSCHNDLHVLEDGFAEFGRYLRETGRPMVYSCTWPLYWLSAGLPINFASVAATCNSWRLYGITEDKWSTIRGIEQWFGNNGDMFSEHIGPGQWNDPDNLVVGNVGLSLDESRAHMALWAMMAAPLLVSADLKNIRSDFKEILLNEDVININQDRLGIMGKRVLQDADMHLWTKPILPTVDGYLSYAVALFNYRTDGSSFTSSFLLDDIGLKANFYRIRNIFEPENINVEGRRISVRVNPSGAVLLTFTPISQGKDEVP